MTIPFIDLQAQRRRIADEINAAISDTVNSGAYIMGPPVKELETALSERTGAAHTISCANGTDALALPMMAWDIKAGDAVFLPSFTFTATAETIAWFGATPIFVDILPDTYNIDPSHLETQINAVLKEDRLIPRAIIAVDLFGQLADYPALSAIAKKFGLKLISDCAQGFGATLHTKHAIAWADAVTTSFFPAKPLGCYGDGGAIQTNDSALANDLLSLRIHGQATEEDMRAASFEHDAKYLNLRVGVNSRLDSIQAAILLEKLKIFNDEIEKRNRIATRYCDELSDVVMQTPQVIDDGVCVWAQFTIEVADRAGLAAHLQTRGVPTAVYYPIPLHQQPAYRPADGDIVSLPVTEEKAGHVISLPMHPYLDDETQSLIIDTIKAFNANRK